MKYKRWIIICSLVVLFLFLSIVSNGCGSPSMCLNLNQPQCANPSLEFCGCFDLVKMRGGYAGGDYDPHDEGIYEAIILRPDSTFELYRRDTLAWCASFEVIRTENNKGKQMTKLKLVDNHGVDLKYRISFEDANHIWLGQINVMDAFGFLFVRYR